MPATVRILCLGIVTDPFPSCPSPPDCHAGQVAGREREGIIIDIIAEKY